MEIANNSVSNFLLAERLKPYEEEARRHPQVVATDLYRWNCLFSGIVLSHTGFVEVYVRNAVDKALRKWARDNGYDDWLGEVPSQEWFDGSDSGLRVAGVPEIIGRVFNGRNIIEQAWRSCRKNYKRWNANPDHRRYGEYPNRDDVFAQFTFGSWTRLIGPVPRPRSLVQMPVGQTDAERAGLDGRDDDWADDARTIWKEALYRAFPSLTQERVNDTHRVKVAKQLERICRLRNRAAHGENMLSVRADAYLDDMLSLLDEIDPAVKEEMMEQTGRMYQTVVRLKYQPEKLSDYQRYDPSSSIGSIAKYEVTPSAERSASEAIDGCLRHSKMEKGKVLVFVEGPPEIEGRRKADTVLLMAADGCKAAIGAIAGYGRWNIDQPFGGYSSPLDGEVRRYWVAVDGLYEVDCRDGQAAGLPHLG
ncbi:hypothetical protein OZX72_08225 [Bifidobacterium sp. ESL0769]|uniref:hypothetical protein n=1 Tax=Bifidobacterium sp. ESL0769 TaxID=2983229 RepID=UPI0023F8C2D5|nr:hypothetical protein [Bifidobacterium sp. ESL0769]WEV67210.1 hypothetical protein OZX72_08225 [Bifidobacterium sp. ESL0769]